MGRCELPKYSEIRAAGLLSAMTGFFPTETVAHGFGDLDALAGHVGVSKGVMAAVEERTGPFQGSIPAVALLPPAVIKQAAGKASVITRIYRPAVLEVKDQHGAVTTPARAEVSEKRRDLTPVEVGQVGLLWRVASRMSFVSAGGSWAA